ncbi:DUF3899 domain-containing protein [Bacillus canaveralius]|nr:DUF3899 domain-containing protein [Bacillus canaveralius]
MLSIMVLTATMNLTFLHFINIIFIISISLLVLGCIMFLIQRDSFNRMRSNFKRFYKSFDQSYIYADQIEGKVGKPDQFHVHNPYTQSILWAGFILSVISLIGSFMVV